MRPKDPQRFYLLTESDGQRLIALTVALAKAAESILSARSVDTDAFDYDHHELTVHELSDAIRTDCI